jgi:serine/threonine protein kinase
VGLAPFVETLPIYRAYDLILDQDVALKFLPAGFACSAAALDRFRNEVRLARQVSHPNVCRVYDIGEIEAAPFLTMEYVDGEDLASLLRRIGRLTSDKALDFARRTQSPSQKTKYPLARNTSPSQKQQHMLVAYHM